VIYLDNAATTPLDPQVRAAMDPWLEQRANPSSTHGPGVRAAEAVDAAARHVASLGPPDRFDVVFTSGGTESNALAVLGSVRAGRRARVVTTAFEHPSVLRNVARLSGSGVEVVEVGPEPDGTVDPAALLDAVDGRTTLVSVMHGNNEVGTLVDVRRIARGVRAISPEAVVHVDAVQTAGKVDLVPVLDEIDLVSLSSHKMHGPMGVGALLVRRGGPRPAPLYLGGDQQGGLRPGTENVAGIVGFGEAARVAAGTAVRGVRHMDGLREAFLAGMGRVEGCREGFTAVARVPGFVALLLDSIPAEPVVHAAEARGVIVSAGSACHARSRHRSHVLEAIGLPRETDCVRVTPGRLDTPERMRRAGEVVADAVRRIRS
jgi:cysteine desulfurase